MMAKVIKNKCWIVLNGSNNDKSLAIVSVVQNTMLLTDSQKVEVSDRQT